MSLKEDARREIDRVNNTIESGQRTSKVAGKVVDHFAPGLGSALDALHSKCPPLEEYKSDLQDVVDGKRDTMPEKPDLRKYYMPR
jgi:hypothetical protein